MIRLSKSDVEATAVNRPAGYIDALRAVAREDGGYYYLTVEGYAELATRYRGSDVPVQKPSLLQQGRSLTRAVISDVGARFRGVPPLSPEKVDARLAQCAACPHLDGEATGRGRCRVCGCFVAAKARLRSEFCPEHKWE